MGGFNPKVKSLYEKSVQTYLTQKSQGVGFENLKGKKEKMSEQEARTLTKVNAAINAKRKKASLGTSTDEGEVKKKTLLG
jgi:hypothetical protein